jgi:hypothetical protein
MFEEARRPKDVSQDQTKKPAKGGKKRARVKEGIPDEKQDRRKD